MFLAQKTVLHKGYKDNPLFIYLFMIFSNLTSWAKFDKRNKETTKNPLEMVACQILLCCAFTTTSL